MTALVEGSLGNALRDWRWDRPIELRERGVGGAPCRLMHMQQAFLHLGSV